MSNFLIREPESIDKVHWDRADEILETFASSKEADWTDLAAMIAEALQSVELNTLNAMYPSVKEETDDGIEEVEVIISN